MNLRPLFRRLVPAFTLVAVFFAGCWKDRLAWSPDGSRAAVIGKDGLRLCDADGRITPLLAPDVYRAAWFDDSRRLAVAGRREIKDYAALVAALGPERAKALGAKAEIVWQLWQNSAPGELASGFEGDDDLGAIVVYLREHHGAALRAKVAAKPNPENDLKELETMGATWHSLVVAQVNGDHLDLGPTLYEGLVEIHDIRPAPGQPAVAFVSRLELSPSRDDGLRIYVARPGDAAPATLVASFTASSPDWTPDGRTLVYLKAASDNGTTDDLKLGALVEREVLDGTGRIRLAEKTRDLAGLIFQGQNRVRCLRDGRVLFDAAEFHLPLAGQDRPTREQLFAIDRTKENAPLTALIVATERTKVPDILTPFEVSSDERQVLFNAGADVAVLTLATGAVERLALQVFNSTNEHNPPQPVWRRAGELVYVKMGDARQELVLRRPSGETVLSRDWPDAVLKQLID
jgi:hypothetical protein